MNLMKVHKNHHYCLWENLKILKFLVYIFSPNSAIKTTIHMFDIITTTSINKLSKTNLFILLIFFKIF
jgi:hypothetical protein